MSYIKESKFVEIKRIIGGILMANCYTISPSPDRASAKSTGPAAQKTPCYIIDPGYDPHKIMNHIAESNLAPEGILLTHHHVDHSGNAAYLRKELDCPIMIHRETQTGSDLAPKRRTISFK
jgi:glyoxylase-like metal-dependent hydrolase (beta-lactamase superfamily II)